MKFWKRLHIYSSHLFLVVADTSLATSHCNAAEPGVEMETAQLSGCVLINEKEPGPTHFQRFSRNLLLSPENQPHMDKVFLPSFLPSRRSREWPVWVFVLNSSWLCFAGLTNIESYTILADHKRHSR